jgi:DNA polymerase-3 subunit alpha
MTDYVHLHLHSEYSLLDGAIRFEPLASHLSETGMSAAAVTDHGAMFGAVEFCDAMESRGLKPIIGMEAYLCRGEMEDRGADVERPYHLTLLAATEQGYRNLCRLSSMAYVKGFYYRPRIDRKALEENCEGLLMGSACLQGEVAQRLLAGDREGARRAVRWYQDLAGRDGFFIELMDHGLDDERRILRDLAELGRETEAPLAATNDAHYLRREHARAHEVLLCLQTGKKLEDQDRMRFSTEEFYVKTPLEMERLFDWVPESLTNTVRIAERCQFSPEKGEFLLPEFEIPGDADSMDDHLRQLSLQGLRDRLGRRPGPEETERLEHELGIISDMGFPGYFLIVSELRRWALSHDIPTGPGRGSAAGSLVSYAIDITDVNPLTYGLSFERFLNPARKQMPDIDLDVCYERRGEIINHIIERYGRESVCQLITFNRMKNRLVVRDVARVMGMSYDEGDRLAKLVATAPDPEAPLPEIVESVPELAELRDGDPRVRELLEYSRDLENIARNSSVHAAGVIVTPGRLDDHVPLYKTKEGEITTQFEKKAAEKIGLLKLDVLGLRTITVIRHAADLARRRDPSLSLEDLDFDDPDTYSLIRSGDTIGVFQLESSGMREALRKIGVSRLDDVVASVAIFRPGSMHMIDLYAENKRGMEDPDRDFSIEYPHPDLEDILSETYGVIIYQEQVMGIANRLAGMSMADADILRRAMSKKDPEVMAGMRRRFMEGALDRGVDRKTAEEVFDQIERFAGYGFNKSHAVCYAILAYQTAYLKAHYPAEFMAANLASEIGKIDKITALVGECKRMGLEIVPPSVNQSSVNFDVDGEGRIVYALSAVKNVGEVPAAAIVREREENGPYRDLYDLCARVEAGCVNRRSLESLTGAGALDCLEGNRASLLASLERGLEYGQKVRQLMAAGQMSLFSSGGGGQSPHRPELLRAPDMDIEEKLRLERSLLGFFLTGHPLDRYGTEISQLATCRVEELGSVDGRYASTAGMVGEKRLVPTRNGDMAFVSLEGREGCADVIVFNDCLSRYGELLEPGRAVFLEGEISERKGDRKLCVSRVIPLERCRREIGAGLELRIEGDAVEMEDLDRAVEAIRSSPGGGRVRVTVRHPSGRKATAVSRSLRVNPTDSLLEELREVLGDESVSLTAGRGSG